MSQLSHERMESTLSEIQNSLKGAFDSHTVLFHHAFEVPKHYSKKNAKTVGFRKIRSTGRSAPFIRSTSESLASERFLLSELSRGVRRSGTSYPIRIPMHLLCILRSHKFKTKDGRVSKRSGDASNLIQGIEDALQKCSIIEDDGLLTQLTILKTHGEQDSIEIVLQPDSLILKQIRRTCADRKASEDHK